MLEKKIGVRAHLLGLLAIFILSSCASDRGMESSMVQGRTDAPDAPQVAVLPFENLSDYPNAGQILTRLVGAELYRQGVYRVREVAELPREPRGAQHGRGESSAVELARQLADRLGTHAVLLGSVTEFRYQHGLHEEPTVGLSVRLVRACDGEVVWASSRSDGGRGFLNRDSLNQAAQRVAYGLTTELLQMDPSKLRCSESPLEQSDSSGQSAVIGGEG